LSERYKALKLPEVKFFETELKPEQIAQLFPPGDAPPESGLDILIEQVDPFMLKDLEEHKMHPNWYPVPSGAHYQRVFFVFIRGDDENGHPVNRYWGESTVKHDPFAPVLQGEGASAKPIYLLTTREIVPDRLFQWYDPISKQISLIDVYKQLSAAVGLLRWSGAVDNELLQDRIGMPFTGGYHFRIKGIAPKKAKLVLVYVSY
jgi:hypothetical protein